MGNSGVGKSTLINKLCNNVNQNVDVDWPLVIEDHYYRKHEIVLSPGEIIIYEGAKLKHGRPQPLQGEKYANIFCHFRISGA